MADAPGTTDDPVEGHPLPDDAVLELLRAWLPHQRWFPAKGTTGRIARVAVIDLTDPLGEAEVRLELLRLPGGGLLHVPVTLRTADGTDRPGTLGQVPAEAARPATVVLDGCHDAAFLRAWFSAATRDTASGGPAEVDLTGMKVAGGEQSNTSVFLPSAAPPAILKVFRGISPGANPDVDVPLALSHAGWGGVPRPLAWLTGSWPAGSDGGEREVGHLGVLSELVVGAQDGFELACRMAGADEDFGDLAEDLGATTAQMHRALRTALPCAPAEGSGEGGPWSAEGVLTTLRERAAAAVAAAPVLAERAPAIDQVLAEVEHVRPLPPLQRVHGDFHLGQVLRSERGWAVLDFEGEPQAPTEERTRPDLALRDLAGMLRSIDYAAAVGGSGSAAWSSRARGRLVAGYHREDDAGPGGAGTATDVLLRALELDKALYEVVYESRNRPTWLPIPLAAVDRLLAEPA